MQLDASEMGDALVVAVREVRIDAVNAIQFKDRLRDIAKDGPAQVVLDMSGVEFVDSSGLGAVVAAMKLLAPDRTLELSGLSEAVEKVFRLTRMDKVFRIHPDLGAFAGGSAHAH